MAITLDSPIEVAFGPRSKKKELAKRLGLHTVGDLLWHLPRRWADPGEFADASSIGQLVEGDEVTVVATVTKVVTGEFFNRRTKRKQGRVTVALQTSMGPLSATFFCHFGQVAGEAARMAVGKQGTFSGKLQVFNGTWQLGSPMSVMDDENELAQLMSGPRPVYPLTKGLYSWDFSKVIVPMLDLVDEIPDPLDEDLRKRFKVPTATEALRWVHAPADRGQISKAMRRFRVEEALILQLVMGRRRAWAQSFGTTAWPRSDSGLLAEFDRRLPFQLTAGQLEIGEQIAADLAQPRPMSRLLQGEVGSGKTLVALRAMLQVVDAGGQTALLAPTEVLAQQHLRGIASLLGDLALGEMDAGLLASDAKLGTEVVLLTGSMPKSERAKAMLKIVSGAAGIVIGTHALLQDKVEFADLGLAVIDEQHRFGVEQRAALSDKAGLPPHVLVMTATPIPRTVAMTVFGDLETSTLTELPAGRAPIQTNVVPLAEQPHWWDRVWQRVREEVAKGHQVYVVCPRITGDETEAGASDQLDYDDEGQEIDPSPRPRPLAAVTEVAEMLRSGPLSDLRVGVLHGQLAADDKDQTMQQFAAGEIDVLVATTVIEVGIDVANATAMVLLDADRFGVSQLHQLRGRVGRGGLPGLCLLVSAAEVGSPARARLEAVASTTDGFELSRFDLEQRREGDVLGRSQSGRYTSLVSLKVLRDEQTISEAREVATELLSADPTLFPRQALAQAVIAMEQRQEAEFMEKS